MLTLHPNSNKPSVELYRKLLDEEAFIVQTIEILQANGEYSEVNYLNQCKKVISNRRKQVKEALKKQTSQNGRMRIYA